MLRPFALRLPRALFFFSLRATFHLERPVVGGLERLPVGVKVGHTIVGEALQARAVLVHGVDLVA